MYPSVSVHLSVYPLLMFYVYEACEVILLFVYVPLIFVRRLMRSVYCLLVLLRVVSKERRGIILPRTFCFTLLNELRQITLYASH
jgi:hypothetical protein